MTGRVNRNAGFVLAAACALSLCEGCAHKSLVDATTTYARSSEQALAELRFAPAATALICRKRAEVAYRMWTSQVAAPVSFEEFLDSQPAEPPNRTTWQERCQTALDLAFWVQRYIDHLATYAYAVEAASSKSVDIGTTASDVTSGIGGVIVMATGSGLATLGKVVGDAAQPIGMVANAVAGQWKADQLGTLVQRGDAQVHTIAVLVIRFLDASERTELAALRSDLRALHNQLAARGSLDASSVSVEIDVHAFAEREQRRLDAAKRIANDVAATYAELADGWAQPDALTDSALAAVSTFSRAVIEDIHEWKEPIE